MNKFYLFSYGTLMDVKIQKILFEQELAMVDALLEDYKLYADTDGYFYIKKYVGNVIHGKILELTKEQMWIADQWEDVPMYLRKKVSIRLKNGENRKVFIYEKNNVQSEIAVNHDSLSNLPLEEVIKEAQILKEIIRLRIKDKSFVYEDI
ncbi:hypothetical protein GKZ28_22530 [Clostridium chromiireducens]|uniref:Putative gamma-glutamylcyclotransferase n=1 Tax=Clostridium chromiireducens TaxID=225345 RepID=A0A964RRN2_9CLOT|nr:gamma-glutamylcyclotransferase family protein [Clostridium chromiireducens]MVX66455.1 hypothetical protein [Clostridium chromiireducens]